MCDALYFNLTSVLLYDALILLFTRESTQCLWGKVANLKSMFSVYCTTLPEHVIIVNNVMANVT